jgi:hypothetical protein
VADEILQDVVHQGLKRHRDVRQTEGHEEFEVPMVSVKCCLNDIGVIHPDLMVVAAEVQFGEELRPSQLVQ